MVSLIQLALKLSRSKLKVAGAAFALSAGLVACSDSTGTTNPTVTGYYPVTVNFTGVSGALGITVTYADNTTSGPFTMNSGGILSLPAGTYTIKAPAVSGKTTPAPQTVTLGPANTSQTVTFAY